MSGCPSIPIGTYGRIALAVPVQKSVQMDSGCSRIVMDYDGKEYMGMSYWQWPKKISSKTGRDS